jgi:hypothetical protein
MEVLFVLLIVAFIAGSLLGFEPLGLLVAAAFLLIPYVFYAILFNAYT